MLRCVVFTGFGALSALVLSLPARADTAIGGRVSSQGFGLVLTQSIMPNLNFRLDGYLFGLDYSSTKDGNRYDFDLKLRSVNALLDWHPFGGNFRLSGGAVYNGNGLDAEAVEQETYMVGNRTFTQGQVGRLTGNMDFRDFAPYLGIGWGQAIREDRRWTFTMDLGVIFQGRPEVTLASTGGTLSDHPVLVQELAEEELELEDEFDFFRFYPVLSIGLNYRF